MAGSVVQLYNCMTARHDMTARPQDKTIQGMTYFLEHIANTLHNEFGNTLNRHCLVFPGRRAGLYFMKYLAAKIEKPVWAPSIMTINELFRSYSSLQIAGNEILLFELYKVYIKIKKPFESFDEFYYWGDILLNDFDDVDKYLVNASLLFKNVLDIKNIDKQFSGLSEEQIEIVRRFWTNFNSGKSTKEKSEFTDIWSVLSDLYTAFNDSLKLQHLAYEGMIYREVAESTKKNHLSDNRTDMVHFIGFNALNECEKVLMRTLKEAGRARFYWDYDNSFIKEGRMNSAGFFLRDNIKLFGNNMPSDWSYDTMLSNKSPEVVRKVIDCPSDVAQVKLVSKLLSKITDISDANAHHTAVILADENLLMPVLTSLPESPGDINITMGYPLKQTPVYTFLQHIMDLQRNATYNSGQAYFGYKEVISILKHSLVVGFLDAVDTELAREIVKTNLIRVPSDRFTNSEVLAQIFVKSSTPAELSVYLKNILSLIALRVEINSGSSAGNRMQKNILNEFIYRVVLTLNSLERIVNSPDITFTTDTYLRIFEKMLRMQSVPFSGEPLIGIQIMGILETRALDFRNLIILSVNEGILPAVSAGSSFIPFSLREAFGIPSVNFQESVYAYHFFRLLQRAENITFIFNSNSEGLRSGEMSRFLLQMKYDNNLKPDFMDLNFEIKSHFTPSLQIERREEHSEKLKSLYLENERGRLVTPSAINTWLNCRMKFYYQYVNQLKEPEVISADIDPAMLGIILHEIMKNLYQPYAGKVINAEIPEGMLRNRQFLLNEVNDAVNEKFKAGRNEEVKGNELIIREVLLTFLRRILKTDLGFTPFTILNLETFFSFPMSFPSGGSEIVINTGGKIDRVDRINNVTRILDYKTGTVSESINSVGDLFIEDRKKDTDGWLQTLLYCEAFLSTDPEKIVRPSVYKIKKLKSSSVNDRLIVKTGLKGDRTLENYLEVRDEFLSGLKELTGKIFSENEPFVMTSDVRGKCTWCPYRTLCMR
jgi:hypothetical protein